MFIQLQKLKVEIGELSNNPQGLLLEAIHSAGYFGALANPLVAPEFALSRLDGTVLEEFIAVRPCILLLLLSAFRFFIFSFMLEAHSTYFFFFIYLSSLFCFSVF